MKLIFTVALLLGLVTYGRAEELQTPEELLVAYVAATGNSDFKKVVDAVHPRVLQSFKTHTLNIVNAAVTQASEAAVITAFQGLGSLNELETFSDKDFWIYVMSNLYSRRPEFDGAKSIDFVGNVEDGEFLYVLYRQDGDLKSTDPIERLHSPRTFTFRRSGEKWCYWSFELSAVERYIQLSVLRHKIIAGIPSSEQAGAGQPATASESKPEGGENPKAESEPASR
jgi:hypothetical protein